MVDIIPCLLNPSFEVASDSSESFVEERTRFSDDLLDIVGVVNLFGFNGRIMLFDQSFQFGVFEGSWELIKLGNSFEKNIECF